MSLAFRAPTAEDYPAVSEIHNAQNEPHFHYPPEKLKRLDEASLKQDAHYRRYLAVLDGEIIATGYLRHTWGGSTRPGRYWVGLYVRRDHQHQDVDTKMLHYALKELTSPVKEVWTVVREDFLGQAGFLQAEGFREQARTWGANLNLEAFDFKPFQELKRRLEERAIRFVPYHTLDDLERHAKVQALHAEAKRDMPTFEPIVTSDFDDVESKDTLPETVVVALTGTDEIVGVASVEKGNVSLRSGLTAVTKTYRNRGVGSVLKAMSAAAAKNLGHLHINSGGAGTDTPILHVNRALGFEIEPAWITLASQR